MKIIAKREGVGKWVELPEKPITVFSKGISVPKIGAHFLPDSKGRKTRGKISSFSVESRKRLRRAMLSLSLPDSQRVGITLTVPWQGTDFAPLMEEFRETFHRFEVTFRRAFPKSAMIYRVELQKRGAPHIHALTYLRNADIFGTAGAPDATVEPKMLARKVVGKVLVIWADSVLDFHHGSSCAFLKHGVKVEPIFSDGAMMRYICDHTSKSKQEQLGYQGKQWGIIGRGNLIESQGAALPDFVSRRHEVLFFRELRKVMRYRVSSVRHKNWKRLPPFGSVLRGSKRRFGEFYLSRENVLRLYDFTKGGAQ